MKFLILGCNGMAGHMVSLYLHERGHSVTGFARAKSRFVDTIIGDAGDPELLRSAIQRSGYDLVVNCVGILNQFAETHRSEAVMLNSFLPHHLAEISADSDTRIIQISTDCVFSGKNGPYNVRDLRDGESFYDRTKALGELDDHKNITIRSSIVGPDLKADGIGLLNWFLQQREEVRGYTGAIWTGQTTLQLAKTIEILTNSNIHGILQLVPETSISKYELLLLFNRYFRNDAIFIHPVEGVKADKSLICTPMNINYSIPPYETMVEDLADWMLVHRELYPFYDL